MTKPKSGMAIRDALDPAKDIFLDRVVKIFFKINMSG